jgi:hypothetical protein
MVLSKNMRTIIIKIIGGVLVLTSTLSSASPVGSSARTVIPSQVQQIISVDCQALSKSNAALAFKAQVLPRRLKEFETVLKSVGVNPDSDLESLTFVLFHDGEQKLRMMAVASGILPSGMILKKLHQQSLIPVQYRGYDIYALSNKMSLTLVDDNTLLLGDESALRTAVDVRGGGIPALNTNSHIGDMIGLVQGASVWSVLDQRGSQGMVMSAVGDTDKLPEYETIKNSLLDTHYAITFSNGLHFDLQMTTSDPATSAKLAYLLKHGALFRKVSAAPEEKSALASLKVNIDKTSLQMHFQANSKEFEQLLRSQFFASAMK